MADERGFPTFCRARSTAILGCRGFGSPAFQSPCCASQDRRLGWRPDQPRAASTCSELLHTQISSSGSITMAHAQSPSPAFGQRTIELVLGIWRRTFPSGVEKEQPMLVLVLERAYEIDAFTKHAGVPPRMNDHLGGDLADAKGRRAREQPGQGRFHVFVCHKTDKVAHPRIPLAKMVPRSNSPCHSRSLGCSSPETMSVAPFPSRAKQRISPGSAMPRMTGECVASRTWAP